MFPFIVKGKVPLGLRRDYHLSEAGLEERIAERLITTGSGSGMRADGSPSGDGRGIIAEGLSRLRSMGFITAARIRRIRIVVRNDFLYAGYEMDVTASTLVSVVVIPLVLGSILFAHSAFGFYETLAILLLLMASSWGVDVFVINTMVRHEISQIASEIRAVMIRNDRDTIESHHSDLSPEDLLATAYYYERNGLTRQCDAYLTHLVAWHPESLEASLALDHLEEPGGGPSRRSWDRSRDGAKASPGLSGREQALKKRRLRFGRKEETLLTRGRYPGENPASRKSGAEKRYRKRLLSGDRGAKAVDRAVRQRDVRLRRRDEYTHAPDEKKLPFLKRLRLGLWRLLTRETRDERRYRKDQARWLHGPGRSEPVKARGSGKVGPSYRRPDWMRPKEERRALKRRRSWIEGPARPGGVQKSRDSLGRWQLLRRSGSAGIHGEGPGSRADGPSSRR